MCDREHWPSCYWDGRERIKNINACKVSLLTGEFDYSCMPPMTRAVADAIPGSRFQVMRPYLLRELAFMADSRASKSRLRSTPQR